MKTLRLLFWMTLLTGVVYPLSVTLLAQFLFPRQSQGSLLQVKGHILGSFLIGQDFKSDRYFWPRPTMVDYNPMPSGASNLGPASKELHKVIQEREQKIKARDPVPNDHRIPADLLCASGSGLDPDISPEAAKFQIERVAKGRKLEREDLLQLVESTIEEPTFGLFGKPRVNVLKLNLALDERFP